jgi:non-specific serine/threonine protein kinase
VIVDETPSKLGGYVVERELGRGGMGVVFLARDPRLDRPVAIKSLSEELGEHPERLARFEREARTLAAINHPNIASVYGLEEHLGRLLLIMEYVPGHHLGEHIRRSGRLEIEEAFAIGVQIASGLEAAHEIGVVHRDLKPPNVRVRPDGVVKVLDFGLAKPEKETGVVFSEDAATMSMAPTAEGRIMGTAGYMSPEQARGKAVDKRADIWAFGVVLFECLTGQRAFKGETPMDALVAILDREPDWKLLPEAVPERIRELLARCLEKDAKKRLRDIGDARIDLESHLAERARVDPRRFMAGSATVFNSPGGMGEGIRIGGEGSVVSGTRSRLPSLLTSFIGREVDLETIRGLLKETRLLTMTGPGGCGKSRLATEFALRSEASFPDGVWSVDLSPIGDAALVGNEVGRVFELPDAEGKAMSERLAEALASRELLLVLDNCEHVQRGAAGLCALLLRTCPGLRVIATSREPLGVDGEWIYRVGALRTPSSGAGLDDAEELQGFESVRLFLDRARAVRPGFSMDSANAGHIAEICRQLDGVPLAIELAAARLKMMGAEEIASRLGDRFKLLRNKAGAPRQQTLLAAIEWSYEQLDATERAALRRLSVFKDGATLSAGEGVLALEGEPGFEEIEAWDVLDLLSQLVDKSMLTVVEPGGQGAAGETRYRVLESIRQYGLERLRESGEFRAVSRAHLAWFSGFAKRAESQLLGRDQKSWFDRLEQEQDNFRAALGFVFEVAPEDPAALELGRQIGAGVWWFWAYMGHLAEGRRLLTRLDRAGAGGEATAAWARLRAGIAWMAMMTGDLIHAVAYGRAGLEMARLSGDQRTIALLLDCLGSACLGDLLATRAMDYFEESLQIRRELGDRVMTSMSICGLAGCHRLLGAHDKSRAMYQEAMDTLRGVGDGLQSAFIHRGLGRLELVSVRADKAFAHLHTAGEALLELGAMSELPGVIEGMACVAAVRGDASKAVRLFAASGSARQNLSCPSRPSEDEDNAPWRASAEAALDSAALEKARAEGAAMRLRRAVRYALEGGAEGASAR